MLVNLTSQRVNFAIGFSKDKFVLFLSIHAVGT